MLQNLLKVQEVARLMGISKCLVYQLVRTGELQAVRINSSIRFRNEDIQDYIDQHLCKEKYSNCLLGNGINSSEVD